MWWRHLSLAGFHDGRVRLVHQDSLGLLYSDDYSGGGIRDLSVSGGDLTLPGMNGSFSLYVPGDKAKITLPKIEGWVVNPPRC